MTSDFSPRQTIQCNTCKQWGHAQCHSESVTTVFHVHNLSDSKFGVFMHVKVLTQERRALTHKLPKYKNKTETKKISFIFYFILRGWKLQYRGKFTLWSHKKWGALLCRTVLKTDWSCQFCISALYASPVISLPSSFSGEIPLLSVFMCLTHAQNFLVDWGWYCSFCNQFVHMSVSTHRVRIINW